MDLKLPLLGLLGLAVKRFMLELEPLIALVVDERFPLTYFGSELQGFDVAKALLRYRSIFEPDKEFRRKGLKKGNVEFTIKLSERIQKSIYLEYSRLEKMVFGK